MNSVRALQNIKELTDTKVLYVETNQIPQGIASSFSKLESKIPTLKQRKFFGIMFSHSKYWAAVELKESDDAQALGLNVGTLPGGTYLSKKISNWDMSTLSTEIPAGFNELTASCKSVIDESRPFIEFYRSQKELILLAPAKRSEKPELRNPIENQMAKVEF